MCVSVCVCERVCVSVCVSVNVSVCAHAVSVYTVANKCTIFITQQEVLDIARDLLEEIQVNPFVFGDSTELERKLKQTKAVLEM